MPMKQLACLILMCEKTKPLKMIKLVRRKEPRLIPEGEFETVQLKDNPTWLVRNGVEFPLTMKKRLVECLRANAILFVISPGKMSGIYLGITCHQLNIDPSSGIWPS